MALTLIVQSASVILLTSIIIWRVLRGKSIRQQRDALQANSRRLAKLDAALPEDARNLREVLRASLPNSIITLEHATSFETMVKTYHAQQASDVVPSCIVHPCDAEELATAVKILKITFDEQHRKESSSVRNRTGLFAVRSGGRSPVAGASSIEGGVLIDLSRFKDVQPAADGKSVTFGAGCTWVEVYQVLEKKGLAVVGGRNAMVGVGGLTLGGGLSFFSPRFGFVCSNIIEYEIVLADGSIARASVTSNPDLWRALKGGANNFGIVTRFTARAFPSPPTIWSGFVYLPSSQAPAVLSAFHEVLDRVITNEEGKVYDENAAGPVACFTYLHQLGIQAISVILTHTKSPTDNKKWPTCWQTSSFSRLWRFWSTCGTKSLTAAMDELSVLNPAGRRQEFATTTIKNDRDTLEATHKAYHDAIAEIRRHGVRTMSWTLVLQPMLPNWARKGDANVLGLADCTDEPLVNVSFTVNWALAKDDETVQRITRTAIEQIDAFATGHGTGHGYRYINYCGSWQSPFAGYGDDNLEFMREVSTRYDPEGLFQRGCVGGFKLGVDGGR